MYRAVITVCGIFAIAFVISRGRDPGPIIVVLSNLDPRLRRIRSRDDPSAPPPTDHASPSEDKS